jgi:ribose transport system substrate-binding protein
MDGANPVSRPTRIAAAMIAAVVTIRLTAGVVTADAAESPRTVVLALAPIGNAWHTAMIESWRRTGAAAIRDGTIAAAPIRVASADTIAAEAAQFQALIAERPAAIVIDTDSPEALNGFVRQACDAGIVVVSFDGIVTEPCAYRIQYDFRKLGAVAVDALARLLPSGGNLLEVRGINNSDLDDAIHEGVVTALATHPTLRIVAAVRGRWRRGEAMRTTASVLPVLPRIDGVITQGGDGLGVADALAAGGRPMPAIILSNRAEELAWWKTQRDATGYQTFSIAPSPGIASLAFWIAQMILEGRDVPHDVTMPFLTVDAGDLDQVLKATTGGFYTRDYTRAGAEQLVATSRP